MKSELILGKYVIIFEAGLKIIAPIKICTKYEQGQNVFLVKRRRR